MLKHIVKLEFMVVDKLYHFICDSDSPIEHIKEALFKCQHLVGQIEEQIKAQLESQEAAKEPKEEVKEDGNQQESASGSSS